MDDNDDDEELKPSAWYKTLHAWMKEIMGELMCTSQMFGRYRLHVGVKRKRLSEQVHVLTTSSIVSVPLSQRADGGCNRHARLATQIWGFGLLALFAGCAVSRVSSSAPLSL